MSEIDDKLERLLGCLGSRKEANREAAKRQARALPQEELVRLIDMEAKQNTAWLIRAAVLTIPYYLLVLTIPFAVVLLLRIRSHEGAIMSAFTIFMVMRMNHHFYVQMPCARRCLMEVIDEIEDPTFVPAALSLLQTSNIPIRASIDQVLLRLLPRVSKDQADEWTPLQRKQLLATFVFPVRHFEAAIGILEALQRIGDDWALPTVRKLTRMNTNGTFRTVDKRMAKAEYCRRLKMIREAAEACLPFLEMRMEEQKQAETLLRASEPGAAAPDTLLRAAEHASPEIPPEQLLRPKAGE